MTDPHPARRWRRFQSDVIARLETLRRGSPEDLLLHPLSVSQPATLRSLADRSGLDAEPAETALSGLVASGQIVPLGTPLPPLASSSLMVMSLRGWQQLGARSTAILREYHSQYPLRSGMPREELKSRLQGQDRWPAKLFNEVVALATKQGILLEAGETLALPGHRPTFTPEQLARVEQLLAAFRRQPYAPPSMAEAIGQVGAEVVNALVNQGTLVRLNDEVLLLVETHREMRERVVAHMRQNGSITVAQVRDLFATSRKYALALVENLDEQKVTRRVGDERVLR